MGVRGIALAEGDKVISLSILRHVDASAEERVAYLRRASAVRRGLNGAEAEEPALDAEEAQDSADTIELGEQRYVEMSAAEQFVLTISERGYGKRSSSYEGNPHCRTLNPRGDRLRYRGRRARGLG
jgi:DNA gyrase subunit A